VDAAHPLVVAWSWTAEHVVWVAAGISLAIAIALRKRRRKAG